MVVSGHEHSHALLLGRRPEPPGHPKGLGHGDAEALRKVGLLPGRSRELNAHEEGAARGIARILSRTQDVAATLEQATRDAQHNSWLVRTGYDEPKRLPGDLARRLVGRSCLQIGHGLSPSGGTWSSSSGLRWW